ncbi:MAG: hydroxysqualene dehydroxylase HpnE [Alphaproteobacteria bacterium]|nr:hydroxysqualene dehydroxylase HpnE [Alphaproteobacteria bacterium]
MEGRTHIIGAGLAGLACAVRLAGAGQSVTLHEATAHAGGRCRSYRDPVLDCEIDNGNHLILSGNRAMLAYLAECGAADELWGPAEATFPFRDIATNEHWALRPNGGRLPWWLCAPARRAPDGGLFDHLGALTRLRGASADDTVEGILGGNPLYARLWRPLAVSILNTMADEASALLLWRTMEESLALGGAACRPLFPRQGLGQTFVDLALTTLEELGAEVRFNTRLRGIKREGYHARALKFADGDQPLDRGDSVVLALPPDAAARLLPDLPALTAPWEFHPILNAHFKLGEEIELPGGQPFLGVTGGEWVDWIFVRGDMLSVTLSAAGERTGETAEDIAPAVWREVLAALDIANLPLPPCRIVKEQRATIAQTPAQAARRQAATAPGGNILLAGDWTDTGLPCTIEGAIRSGHAAAALAAAGGSE